MNMNQATNAAIMRASNRKLILNLIRLNPISRAELAAKTSLTRASITQIIDELLEAGLVEPCPEQEDCSTGSPGRRRTLLSLKHRARFVFGVHISRRRCRVGAVDLYGDVICESDFSFLGLSPEETADQIAAIILTQQKEYHLSEECVIGIGISAPGPVDYHSGIILNPPNFKSWHHTPICDMLTERTGFPALLEKDTNARTLEEMYFGAAAAISSFMLVQIDDGVGSGVVIHNALYRGTGGMGTELGHTTIRFDGPPCSCGNRGCLENYLRMPALLKNSRFENWSELTAQEAEADASILLDIAAQYLSAALVNAINLYDLEKIILTGDVAFCPEPLLTRLNPLVSQRVLSRTSIQDVPVTASLATSPVRTGAMAALYDVFQER